MPQPSLEADFRPGRRDLMRAGVATFLLGIQFSTGRVVAAPTTEVFAPDAFIRITASGEVTLIMPQVEMGQGIYTALAMLIAEELDLAMDAIALEAAPANEALYGNPILKIQATGGSTSIPAFYEPLRLAGATARAMLVSSAAQRWVVASDECRTEAGRVFHDGTKHSASYGELVPTVARQAPPAHVMLKKPSSFRLIGMPQRRLDTAAKVNGALKYGIDAMPDGVKYATMTASPVPEGTLATVDESQIGSVAGVRQVLRFDDMVAVVGDHSWAALRGLAALGLVWDDGRFATLSSESLRAGLNEAAGGQPMTVKDQGHALDLLRGAGVTAQSYEFPMLAHAPMEPMNCTVHVTSERCEVWVGTQVLARAQQAAAEESDLAPEQVVIHNHLLGGGFGRRLEVDFIRRAVRIARRVDGPVKVFWSREEDITSAMYRPIYGVWLSAKLDRGRPVAWRHLVAGPAIAARWLPEAYDGGKFIDAVDGADELPYDLPNFRLEYVRHELPAIPTCFWRGIAPNVNVFAVESFVDRLAREAHTDPVAFRRQLLDKSPRARVVLDLAAEKARWGNQLPPRSGRGISLQFAFGSHLATVAEVAVDDDGGVSIKRLLCVVDCGTVVNPDGVVAQIQGGLVFGLSAVLHGEITVAEGRIQQSNFHDYRVLRIDEIPEIEVHIVRSDEPPGGLGEPGTSSVQPAVANAIYAATGVHLTKLPVDRSLLVRGAKP